MICTRTKMNGGNGSLNITLLVFDGNNWNRWIIHMCMLFVAQDFLDLVNDGYTPIAENATKAQRNEKCDTRKKDQKEYLYIRQCMDMSVFKKIGDATKAKAMCDTLV